MLGQQVRDHISKLSNPELLEYVLTGQRMYEPEAVAFAKEELDRRQLTPDQSSEIRGPILEKLVRYDADTPVESVEAISAEAIICSRCAFEVPNRYVEYQENIGAMVLNFSKCHKGHLCKDCNNKVFLRSMLITFFFGWWGLLSFFFTIAALISNLIMFLRTRSLSPAPPGAGPPILDEAAISRISPNLTLINERLAEAISVIDIAREIAPIAGVTPGQALFYVHATAQERLSQAYPPVYGFPVIMKVTES